MPTTTNKTNLTGKTNTPAEKQSPEAIRIAELEAMIKQLTENMAKIQGSNIVNNYTEEERDINPNKKTRITSLTYGYFSLYAPNRGFLKFPNYGSYHTVSYAQLVDYVNTCRVAAENGNFYIHNQEMVEDLGLSETYEAILNDKIIDKILFSNDLEIKDILANTTDVQKNSICALVCNKVFNKEMTDMGKIDEISKAIGVDILKKVGEMKDTSDFLSND